MDAVERAAALREYAEQTAACTRCALAAGAHAGRLRRGKPERRSDVRRRGARLPRGPAGRPVRRAGRQAARQAARRDRAHARRRLRRERPEVPAAREPRPAAGGDRGLRAAPLPADRADPSRASSRRSATSRRSSSRAGRPGSRASTGRSRRSTLGGTHACCSTRSTTRPPRSTRRRCSRCSRRTSRAFPELLGARRSSPPVPVGRARGAGRRARSRQRSSSASSDAVQLRARSALGGGDGGGRRAARARARARATSSPSRASSAPARRRSSAAPAARSASTAPVTSPTFTIGHRYEGRVDVSHLDLYRFAGCRAAEWGDLEPYFDDAIVFVEWPEAGAGVAPASARRGHARARRADATHRRIETRRAEALLRRHRAMLDPRFRHGDRRRDERARRDGDVLGERASIARTLLEDVDALLRDADAEPRDLDALVVGTGPGSFTEHPDRPGDRARARARARRPGRRRLDARRARRRRAERAFPVIDARRREVFVPGPRVVAPDDLELEPGTFCVGEGAVRYRASCSSARARAFRRTTTSCTSRTPRLHASLARDVRAGRCGRADLRPRARREARSCMNDRAPPPRAARPRRDRGDRARVVPDAVVALDVRRASSRSRARSALGAFDPERRARRLPDSSRATSTPGT